MRNYHPQSILRSQEIKNIPSSFLEPLVYLYYNIVGSILLPLNNSRREYHMKTPNHLIKPTTATIALYFGLLSPSMASPSADIANAFNSSSTPSELVSSGWALNNGDKPYKVLQVNVTDTDRVVELRINKDGNVVENYDSAKTINMDLSYDYKMSSTSNGWSIMGSGENGPLYHMMPWGELSFDGPKQEAIQNMGPFTAFLVLIGSNINNN
jgi:putative sterol carrier protein